MDEFLDNLRTAVLTIKESYSKGKKGQHFYKCLTVKLTFCLPLPFKGNTQGETLYLNSADHASTRPNRFSYAQEKQPQFVEACEEALVLTRVARAGVPGQANAAYLAGNARCPTTISYMPHTAHLTPVYCSST